MMNELKRVSEYIEVIKAEKAKLQAENLELRKEIKRLTQQISLFEKIDIEGLVQLSEKAEVLAQFVEEVECVIEHYSERLA